MKNIEVNITGKNTMKVIETSTGVLIVLKESESINKPNIGDVYYYIVFNTSKGFFPWNTSWYDNEMDNNLFDSGNCFSNFENAEEIANEFNNRLKLRLNETNL